MREWDARALRPRGLLPAESVLYFRYVLKLQRRRGMATLLEDAQANLVRRWGEMGGYWGINRTMAEIHALLYVSAIRSSMSGTGRAARIRRMASLVTRIVIGASPATRKVSSPIATSRARSGASSSRNASR